MPAEVHISKEGVHEFLGIVLGRTAGITDIRVSVLGDATRIIASEQVDQKQLEGALRDLNMEIMKLQVRGTA